MSRFRNASRRAFGARNRTESRNSLCIERRARTKQLELVGARLRRQTREAERCLAAADAFHYRKRMEQAQMARIISAFHSFSARDPAAERVGGVDQPRELVQAERLAAWVSRVRPDASPALRLAAHCQHIGRFEVPRSSYPEGRSGYLRWRAELARRHAATAENILREHDADPKIIESVKRILLKQDRANDAEVQAMEDALCLAFLEHEFAEFSSRHDDEKLVRILRKTWAKMSDAAHAMALELPLDQRGKELVTAALNGPQR